MKKILIILLITAFFIVYLFQHHYSINCTQEIAKLEKQKQLLQEELITLETQKNKTFLFANLLDSAQQLKLTFPKRPPNQVNSLTNLTDHSKTITVSASHNPNE
jgi:uncharacterized protein (DUF3084 family)